MKCPVIELPMEAAVRDMQNLINGDVEHSLAFNRCTTCNVCDFVCPEDALPYELILESFDDWHGKHGLPFFAKMVFPNETENIWSGLRVLMNQDEISLLESWKNRLNEEHEEIVLTGFYTNIVPFLAQLSILDDMREKIVGSEGLWGCGGDSNKLGHIELTEQIVELLKNTFSPMGLKRVYCFMEAEAVMLNEVLPERYGFDFNIQFMPLDYLILDRMKQGMIEITNKLNIRATVHDNCMSRYDGGRPQEVVREIAKLAGCELLEMEHSRFNGLCCGWAATIPTLHGKKSDNPLRTLLNLISNLYRRLEEAEATGAEVIISSCPACYIFLSLIAVLSNSELRVYHPLEIVDMACGGTVNRKVEQRCWDIMAVTVNILFLWISSRENRKRFFPKSINTRAVESLAPIRDSDSRRIIRAASFFRGVLVQNRYSRAIIRYVLKGVICLFRRFQEIEKRQISHGHQAKR